jgi:hypothetical protein
MSFVCSVCVDKLVDPVTYGCSGLSINCGHSVIGLQRRDPCCTRCLTQPPKRQTIYVFLKMVFPKKKEMMVAVRALVINA